MNPVPNAKFFLDRIDICSATDLNFDACKLEINGVGSRNNSSQEKVVFSKTRPKCTLGPFGRPSAFQADHRTGSNPVTCSQKFIS